MPASIQPGTGESDQNSAPARRDFILGTAGHIDHGKTTLIKALTGTDTDRLPEEKQRGMTIELGFAELDLGDVAFGVVDVPGHERFVRTMVAGATGVDLALIIVAADDSVMPQTREHVEILNLLGVERAVVAITKCDTADEDMIDLVELEIRELLAETALADALVVRVSAVSGRGMDELKDALRRAVATCVPDAADAPFRLPVDRVFSVSGRGTVVTGSVVSGQIRRGDTVDILPGGLTAKVREIQNHHRDADATNRGQRTAINLQGVDKSAIQRGDELVESNRVKPTRLIDARMTCLTSHVRPIKNNSRVRLCIGTRELIARVVSLTGGAIAPGDWAYVQLRLRDPVVAIFGQRFIVRDENAARTAGGGVVLRCARRRIGARHASEIDGLRRLDADDVRERVDEVLRYARFEPIDDSAIAIESGITRERAADAIATLTKQGRLISLGGSDRLVSKAYVDAFLERAAKWLAMYHQSHPDEPGCPPETVRNWLERRGDRTLGKPLLDQLLATKNVRSFGRYVCHDQFAPQLSNQDEKLLVQLLDEFDKAAYQPPSRDDLTRTLGVNAARVVKLIKLACAMGELVEFGAGLYLHQGRERAMRDRVSKMYAEQGPFTVAQLREALSSSRKYTVPLAEYLDRAGLTQRNGDQRDWIGDTGVQ